MCDFEFANVRNRVFIVKYSWKTPIQNYVFKHTE